ncbi:hypothetical protein [Sphingomonas yabuuchiae]|uniref:Uncharacterized protein n=1 Tax=Sphingomonas yabuuchiae TaxID=172044 RepID=A0AA41DAZ2_9SPHN|nr:hypothetical protein [Sphingomonas yabuuchiae]MBB4611602.1 hypothetical protein [Sphingomonas yabuuchiae]MBN3556886.1 hypothetical protein [Sphingomonas yabuuchiae]
MSLIVMPGQPVASNIDWTIDQPAQVNRGEFTGKRRVTLLTAAPRWYATVSLPPILGEDAALAWRAFVVDCDGIANRFKVIACERDQVADNPVVVVDGSGQGGRMLRVRGWGSAGTKLRRGHFVTVNEQLLSVQADVVVGADGRASIAVKPYIRIATTDGAPVEVKRPYAVMAMSDPKNGWKVGIGQNYGVSFNCEEAF